MGAITWKHPTLQQSRAGRWRYGHRRGTGRVAINTATALMFMSGRRGDLNIRGAFLHMAAGAVHGVVLAGIAIIATDWLWFDPVVSLIIVAVVVVGRGSSDSVNLALDAVPAGIEPLAVQTYLAERRCGSSS